MEICKEEGVLGKYFGKLDLLVLPCFSLCRGCREVRSGANEKFFAKISLDQYGAL